MNFLKRNSLWLVPILLMLLITPFTPAIDMAVAKWTHTGTVENISPSYKGFSSNAYFDIMFNYGCIPAWLTCCIAAVFFVLSFYRPKFASWRQATLVISLSFIIGAGFFTHLVFKEFWGRPRPKQLIEFGGKREFRPYFSPSFSLPPQPHKSFPSGHSTTGFYFFCIYFLGRRYKKPGIAAFGALLALFLGISLSLARIMQGGHFVSDVIFAALVMWETAYFVDWLVFETSFFSKILKIKHEKSDKAPERNS